MITAKGRKYIELTIGVTAMKEPKAGEKLSEQEAQAYVDYLYKALYKYAHEKIFKGTFMTQLREGKLPMPVMRQFFKNWGHFSLEVNALNAVSYYTHLPFFVRNFGMISSVLPKGLGTTVR
jgi:hypothetical protein